MSDHTHLPICTSCYAVRVEPPRARLGFTRCLACAEKFPETPKRTVVPLHKSAYMLVTDADTLKQLDPKRANT